MRLITLLLAFGVTATALVLAQAPRSIEAQFKAAQHAEEIEGDLHKAMEQYRRISQTGDRAVAVRALDSSRRMPSEARRVRNQRRSMNESFANTPIKRMQLTLARTRSATRCRHRSLRVLQRSVSSPRALVAFRPTADMFRVTDCVLEIISHYAISRPSQVRTITKDGVAEHPNEQYPLASAFSRDGKQIAYDWYFESEIPQRTAGSCDDRRRRNRRPERYTTMLISPPFPRPTGPLMANGSPLSFAGRTTPHRLAWSMSLMHRFAS